MAVARGLPSRYNTSAMASSIMENPAHQKMLRDATAGRDNRAVSNESQIMGQMIAGEQKRQMGNDEIGRELSRRKDELAFAQKKHQFVKDQFGQKIDRIEQERNVQNAQFQKELGLKQSDLDMKIGNQGIEMGLGLLSTAGTVLGDIQARKQHKEQMNMYRQIVRTQAGIKYDQNNDTMGEWDEDTIYTNYSPSESYVPKWSRRD